MITYQNNKFKIIKVLLKNDQFTAVRAKGKSGKIYLFKVWFDGMVTQ
jgi:hypothetical protein